MLVASLFLFLETRSMNPFQVLGANRDLLLRMNDEQRRQLLNDLWRSLSRMYHPDRNKSGTAKDQFALVQWAKSELTEEHSYRRWLKIHLRTRAEELAQAKSEAEDLKNEARSVCAVLESFLAAAAVGRSVLVNQDIQDNPVQVSIFNPPHCRILLSDDMTPVAFRAAGAQSAVPPQNYELEFGQNGVRLVRYPVRRIEFDPVRDGMRPDIPLPFYDSIKRGSKTIRRRWERRGEGEEICGALVGSLSATDFSQDKPNRRWTKGFLPGTANKADFEAVFTGYPWRMLRSYLPYISPVIKYGEQLIVATADGNGNPACRLVGRVIKIFVVKDVD